MYSKFHTKEFLSSPLSDTNCCKVFFPAGGLSSLVNEVVTKVNEVKQYQIVSTH